MSTQPMMEDNRQHQIDLAQAMRRIIETKDFEMLFNEQYLNAFAITNVHNAFAFDGDARRRFMEKTLARSYFSEFIITTIEDGNQASLSLANDDDENMEESYEEDV